MELTRLWSRYYNLATDFYEFGFGQSFHFYRPALGESFRQGIIRHEHYLASARGIKKDMKVLDVGCGVGGPAREIAKFTGCHVTGLNINEYQVQRAARYAKKVDMEDQLEYVQGDFMVFRTAPLFPPYYIHTTVLTVDLNRTSLSPLPPSTQPTPSRQPCMPPSYPPSTPRSSAP